MKKQELLKYLSEADYKDNSLFQNLIMETMFFCKIDADFLATKLGVSIPTVRRWMNGQACPHQFLRPGIQKILQTLVEEVK